MVPFIFKPVFICVHSENADENWLQMKGTIYREERMIWICYYCGAEILCLLCKFQYVTVHVFTNAAYSKWYSAFASLLVRPFAFITALMSFSRTSEALPPMGLPSSILNRYFYPDFQERGRVTKKLLLLRNNRRFNDPLRPDGVLVGRQAGPVSALLSSRLR